LYGRTGRLTAKNGGFRPGQFRELDEQLKEAGLAGAKGAKLPKKKLRHTAKKLDKRQDGLQDWLSEAVDRHGDQGLVLGFLAPPVEKASPPEPLVPPPEELQPVFALFEAVEAAVRPPTTLWGPSSMVAAEREMP
jgi:hypothetical protein